MKNKWKFTAKLLKKLYKNNTFKQIAKKYNCTIGIVWYYLKKFKIKTRKRGYNSKNNNNNYIDGRWNKQHYCPICKTNPISYPTWRKNGKCMKCFKKSIIGKNNSQWKGGKSKCKDCDKLLSSYTAKYCNNCKGKYITIWRKGNYKGKNNPMYGKTTQTKQIRYKENYMRSSWEYKFAFFLDCSNINWQYEPKRFYMENITYLPDFYLPEFDCYIEIKGFFNKNGKERFDTFKQNYPNINIKVLMLKELQELGILQ